MARFNELVTELSVDIEDKTVKALDLFNKQITDITSGLQTLGSALTGKKSFSEILFGSATESQRMINTANSLKLSLKEIQEWSRAASTAGVVPDQVLADISHMQNVIGLSRDQILKFADDFTKSSVYGRQALQQFYEFGDSTATLFTRGRKEIEKYMASADKTLVSDDNLKKLDELQQKINDLKQAWSNMLISASSEYATTINKWLEEFQKFLEDGEKVKKVLKGIKIGLMALAGAQALSMFASLLKNINTIYIAFKRMLQLILLLDSTFVSSILRWGGYLTALYGAIKLIVAGLIMWEEWGYQDKLKEAGGAFTPEGQELMKKHRENTKYLNTITSGIEKFDNFFSQGHDATKNAITGVDLKEDLSDLMDSLKGIERNTAPLKRETPGMIANPMNGTFSGATNSSVTNNIENTIYTSAPIAEVLDATVKVDESGNIAIMSMS